ncbi:acyl-CoA N-acyltransferase [Mycotypha africana]|uniref:acyl-CoA N-acyltransferase n=1 Tax=Mycotypha africana TaxID=64632 RepID=UPI0023003404|nr:acyl-CoA N-acyltransferase [Mycotypha africana]KAI8977625.1 acyl-CoA N-acyltransferase [Mycotypha africana]
MNGSIEETTTTTKTVRRATTPPLTTSSEPLPANVNKVVYGQFEMGAWFYSPYPADFGSLMDRLYICDFCLRYMKKDTQLASHKLHCKAKKPPGRVIYSNNDLKVYEVDGQEHKLYCQNLCLLAKLFLDNKTLYFDTEGFNFYVLTERNSRNKSVDNMVAYFSKEKISYDNYNLACIMTLPSHQRRGYGRLLIELSYEFSKREGKIGSPEKPLSRLGSLGYQSYWSSTILASLIHFEGDVTIDEICKETCIHKDDVIDTLARLDLLCYRKTLADGRQNICITHQMIEDTLTEFNIKLGRKLNPECIKWK